MMRLRVLAVFRRIPCQTCFYSTNTVPQFNNFRDFPLFPSLHRLIKVAGSDTQDVKRKTDIGDPVERTKRYAMDFVTRYVESILQQMEDAYDSIPENLHPFEESVLDLTYGIRWRPIHIPSSLKKYPSRTIISQTSVEQAFNHIEEPKVHPHGYEYIPEDLNSRLQNHPFIQIRRKLHGRLSEYLTIIQSKKTSPSILSMIQYSQTDLQDYLMDNYQSFRELEALFRGVRKLPALRYDHPTVAIVGAPNVGKSTLVRAISTARPEVQAYPFTTRALTTGHLQLAGLPFQITDTPGVLPRAHAERNPIELLAFSICQHLPCIVIFLIDLSTSCGTSIQDQLALRNEFYEKFGQRPWIDVLSKVDLSVPDTELFSADTIPHDPIRIAVISSKSADEYTTVQTKSGKDKRKRIQESEPPTLIGIEDLKTRMQDLAMAQHKHLQLAAGAAVVPETQDSMEEQMTLIQTPRSC
eukprot:TRINITY_DN713_c0_g1::TRINITY_DN713_c0_g1_i1::g.18336::m.18336 TRINITY_DN713_c0_g1::TRINITY_DN713_c0_g1_i1::g.18336  ORF type:complete len:489 (-),score=27.80,sp/Q8SVJ8/NOG1_ENCCU/39.19/2e-25,MMR_HSR1/PF01926.18/5.8e-17,NOG1/PF06858.9/6.2e-16,FeoB_N/PF02421.13/1.1e-08,Dynamin_N/PF00350.18/2e+03,Dynamin_N/PF00350.18/1.7,Dynamin_N/PF00350.18/13,AAA_28/PF13521.1/0.029,AAA_16/PF13191.1/9.3e+03,AAA_16/PF13191.1/0.067,Miro/PF08477.8/0.045,AAA_29/PF13555.1/0.052,AAA_17/PF13207.1/0.07,MobB/PF03205.9/0.09